MTAESKKPAPKIQNPRYKGATPEMVARAVMMNKPKGGDGKANPARTVTSRRVRSGT